jgi:hypothetical protein
MSFIRLLGGLPLWRVPSTISIVSLFSRRASSIRHVTEELQLPCPDSIYCRCLLVLFPRLIVGIDISLVACGCIIAFQTKCKQASTVFLFGGLCFPRIQHIQKTHAFINCIFVAIFASLSHFLSLSFHPYCLQVSVCTGCHTSLSSLSLLCICFLQRSGFLSKRNGRRFLLSLLFCNLMSTSLSSFLLVNIMHLHLHFVFV